MGVPKVPSGFGMDAVSIVSRAQNSLITIEKRELMNRDFPGSPVVKTSPSSAGGLGSIPSLGAKISVASWPKKQKIKQKQYCSKFNEDLFKWSTLKKKIFKKLKRAMNRTNPVAAFRGIGIYRLFFHHKNNTSSFSKIGPSLVAQMVESACNAGDQSSIPGSGRSPREENGNPLQYSCLANPMDGRACWLHSIKLGKHKKRKRETLPEV